jgi:peroxiredoxin
MQGALLAVAVVLLGLILISLWVVLYQLIKQQGRMLLHLDDVEARLARAGWRAGKNEEPQGLAVGTPVAPFRLPDLNGQTVALEDFKGKRVLLVNWNPQCGFCDLIAPDLARLQEGLQKHNVQLLLLSRGDAAANRQLAEEHHLECPILLPKEKEQELEAFQNQGTPAAYLLNEEGQVMQPLAVGADKVPALAKEAAGDRPKRKRLPGERPLSESRIERNGLKAGTPAPAFRLPDVRGGTVALEEYRGRQVLLVFSDPHCGPCDELLPHLVRVHQQHRDNGLALILVGRGQPEENRRKAEAHGCEFPVVVQDKWKLSKEYGIFATPVAFLIGEDGVIARNVARGVDEILELAPHGMAAGTEKDRVELTK